ncbi:MAG: response regulator transcription factor [Myxococcota bacterium]
MNRLLLVDDDDRLRPRLARALRDRGLDVIEAATPEQALLGHDPPPDRCVLDLRLGDASGMDLLPALQERFPAMQIVIMTGYGSIATAVEAMRMGARNYVSKPVSADGILAAFDPGHAADPEPASLARAEWEHIHRVLEDCDGNITQAAKKLGLHRRTLQRKLQAWPPRS